MSNIRERREKTAAAWCSPSGGHPRVSWGGGQPSGSPTGKKKGDNNWSKSRDPLERDCCQSNASYVS